MRSLGVDLGDRKVGLAVSDELGLIASPLRLEKVYNPEQALERVLLAIKDVGAGRVILGLPRQLDGREGKQAKICRTFAEKLAAAGVTVELWDERLTSAEAERALKSAGLSRRQRNQHQDAVAAQRLLESWLGAQAARRRREAEANDSQTA